MITATGAVAGKQRRALDSTILDDAVARQDTVTQLIAQIRRVGREVPGAKDLIATECTRLAALTGQGYEAPGKPPIAWDDRAAREALVSALVGDALALLRAVDLEAIQAAGGKPAQALALLALVAGQDVEPAEDSDGTDGRWRIAAKTAPDRVISTVDPDTRHAHKTRQPRPRQAGTDGQGAAVCHDDRVPTRLTVESVIGPLDIEADDDGLTRIRFDADPAGLDTGPRGDAGRAREVVLLAGEQIAAYSAGRLRVFDLPLAPRGTDFRRRVWDHLATIPWGRTSTYGAIAAALGLPPGASRAVGAANGANPLPIVLPCHRVIGADGTLTGYAGGLGRKAALLRLEGVRTEGDQDPLF